MALADLEARVRRLEDTEAVKRLKIQFCNYQDDNNNPDGLASLFVEDGVWHTRGGPIKGPDAIRKHCASQQAAWPFAKHYALHPTITIKGDEAHATWQLFGLGTLAEGNQAVWFALRLEEDYVRVEQEWKYKTYRAADRYFTTPFDKGWAKQQAV